MKEWKLFKEALKKSNFAVQVLDSRIALDSRNLKAEELIKKEANERNFPLAFVVNKFDLIREEDQEKVKESIIKNLEKEYNLEENPVFFISAQKRKGTKKLREWLGKLKLNYLPKREECEKLISLIKGKKKSEIEEIIKNLSEEEKEKLKRCKEGLRGVIIGYPNVGKSSLINVLKGRHSAGTSPLPGYTKAIQLIKIANKIYFYDIPGLFTKEEIYSRPLLALINTNKVKDPYELVDFLWYFLKEARTLKYIEEELSKYKITKEFLENLDDWDYFEENLEILAKKNNFVMSGGRADIFRFSKKIIEDWQKGKIKAYRIYPY
ncbi:MAG: GTPase [Nanoarchaeota archaeon]